MNQRGSLSSLIRRIIWFKSHSFFIEIGKTRFCIRFLVCFLWLLSLFFLYFFMQDKTLAILCPVFYPLFKLDMKTLDLFRILLWVGIPVASLLSSKQVTRTDQYHIKTGCSKPPVYFHTCSANHFSRVAAITYPCVGAVLAYWCYFRKWIDQLPCVWWRFFTQPVSQHFRFPIVEMCLHIWRKYTNTKWLV